MPFHTDKHFIHETPTPTNAWTRHSVVEFIFISSVFETVFHLRSKIWRFSYPRSTAFYAQLFSFFVTQFIIYNLCGFFLFVLYHFFMFYTFCIEFVTISRVFCTTKHTQKTVLFCISPIFDSFRLFQFHVSNNFVQLRFHNNKQNIEK